jgi:hypothetical protein
MGIKKDNTKRRFPTNFALTRTKTLASEMSFCTRSMLKCKKICTKLSFFFVKFTFFRKHLYFCSKKSFKTIADNGKIQFNRKKAKDTSLQVFA